MTDHAILANGCFWCTEAIFQRLYGVLAVESGYIGGTVENPSYEQVCSGKTGHAEALRIVYDSSKISYQDILEVFWYSHDPTTLNRQGNDVGTQYRSAIFYLSDEQKAIAEASKEKLAESNYYPDPIVTEITKAGLFYVAEPEHQDFYNKNESYGYCQLVIRPKLQKLMKDFSSKIEPRWAWKQS